MARRATLKDVAAAAGVSVTTVSLVLNDRPARVSTEKREAIARAKLVTVAEATVRSEEVHLDQARKFGIRHAASMRS